MSKTRMTDIVSVAIGAFWLIAWSQSAGAGDALKVIDNPGGGQVVYGPVDQNTPQAAMATVLHYVHTHFDDPPVVGKVFESRDGQNFGAFFTVTAKNQGNKKIAGLVMVSILAEKASAVVTQTAVTPASIKETGSKFSVTAEKGKDGLIHFTITYRLPEPQYLVAHFELRDGETVLTKTDTPASRARNR